MSICWGYEAYKNVIKAWLCTWNLTKQLKLYLIIHLLLNVILHCQYFTILHVWTSVFLGNQSNCLHIQLKETWLVCAPESAELQGLFWPSWQSATETKNTKVVQVGSGEHDEIPWRREHLCQNWWIWEEKLKSNQQVLPQSSWTQRHHIWMWHQMLLICATCGAQPEHFPPMMSINRLSVMLMLPAVSIFLSNSPPFASRCHLGDVALTCTHLGEFSGWQRRRLIRQNHLVTGESDNPAKLFSAT